MIDTGNGKSFAGTIFGASSTVGHSSKSETDEVTAHDCGNGCFYVDTPGFDDTNEDVEKNITKLTTIMWNPQAYRIHPGKLRDGEEYEEQDHSPGANFIRIITIGILDPHETKCRPSYYSCCNGERGSPGCDYKCCDNNPGFVCCRKGDDGCMIGHKCCNSANGIRERPQRCCPVCEDCSEDLNLDRCKKVCRNCKEIQSAITGCITTSHDFELDVSPINSWA
ncbi:497_t:CDS:2 [Diversispora eburnea]|uniref:497_t:CDS:1 n=1 Tax=Diversispora eburnea TaxID=1213867 RepID=A0A9N8YLY6_9GLOM|nr:497_t:CDS:2 [Diversispora eburnea]